MALQSRNKRRHNTSSQEYPASENVDGEEDDYELPQDEVYVPPTEGSSVAEKAKLEALELELQQLRSQMAQFLKISHGMPQSENANPNIPPKSYVQTTTENLPPPPPPPPPAPLSLPLTPSQFLTPKKPVLKDSTLNKMESQPGPASSMSLAEMVRSSGKKSLRKVEGERSPGGTIKKDKRSSSYNSGSHVDIIADALKKKFKNVSSPVSSPDKRNGDDEFEDAE